MTAGLGDRVPHPTGDADRLTRIQWPTEHEVDFVYDADGIKQAAILAEAGTRYVVDGTFPCAQVLAERTHALR